MTESEYVPVHMRGIPEATRKAMREASKRNVAKAPRFSADTKAALAVLLKRVAGRSDDAAAETKRSRPGCNPVTAPDRPPTTEKESNVSHHPISRPKHRATRAECRRRRDLPVSYEPARHARVSS